MSWVLNLLKTIAKSLAPTAAERLLDRALPTKRPEVEGAPWTHKTTDHVEEQIRRATEDFKVTSPRAILPPRPATVLPPPRKPRR